MKKKMGSLYFNTDKNVFDALHNRKFGVKKLGEQLKDRGIFVSHQDDKEELIQYCCSNFTDYHTQKFISETLDDVNQRTNYQSTELEVNFEEIDFKELCNQIKNNRNAHGESSKIHISPNGEIITIASLYTEPDYSKSIMNQNTTKTAQVRIEKTSEGKIKVRRYNDQKSSEITDEIRVFLNESDFLEEPIEEFSVSLEAISSSQARTEFFHELIKNVSGFKVDNVNSVDVNNPEIMLSDEEKEEEAIGTIKNAVLKGESVLNSPEFKNLLKSEFYVTKIQWTAVSESINGDKVDFLAEFKKTDTCTDFVYSVLKVYTCKKDGFHVINGKPPSEIENSNLLPLIEYSAKKAHKIIFEKYGEQPTLESESDEQV